MTTLLPQNETEWQKVVTKAAVQLGWEWLHIGRVGKHRANGAKGTLGTGWPDLVLVNQSGLMFVELKMDGEQLSEQQKHVRSCLLYAGAEYHVWRPSDLAQALDRLAAGR